MNNRTDHGFLVLADVSGFTAFVTTTELEHGSEIIAALLDEVIEHLSPPLEIQEIEGDAVFALGGEDARLPRSRLLQVLEDAFVAFKTRQRALQRDETCGCGACQQIWRLDLKMVVHHGPFLRHDSPGGDRAIAQGEDARESRSPIRLRLGRKISDVFVDINVTASELASDLG